MTQEYRDKPNLLMISPISPPMGGLANQTRLLMNSSIFQEAFSVTVQRSNPRKRVEDLGNIYRVFSLWPLKMLCQLLQSIARKKPDVIFARINGDISFFRNALLALIAARICRCPLMIHLHASRRGFWHSRSLRIKSKGAKKLIFRLLNKYGYAIVRLLLFRADAVSQLTRSIDAYYQTLGFPKSSAIIPNAVKCNSHSLDYKEENRCGTQMNMIFVGRLTEDKGFFDLLEALARFRNTTSWTLDVLGEPVSNRDRERIDNFIVRKDLTGQITLHGNVYGQEKYALYRNAEVLVFPSHKEVFPNVILEAMSYGLSIISTRVGEVESILTRKGVIYVSSGNTSEIAKAIGTLLNDSSLRMSMAKHNYYRASRYSLDNISRSIALCLQHLMKNGH